MDVLFFLVYTLVDTPPHIQSPAPFPIPLSLPSIPLLQLHFTQPIPPFLLDKQYFVLFQWPRRLVRSKLTSKIRCRLNGRIKYFFSGCFECVLPPRNAFARGTKHASVSVTFLRVLCGAVPTFRHAICYPPCQPVWCLSRAFAIIPRVKYMRYPPVVCFASRNYPRVTLVTMIHLMLPQVQAG